MTTANEPSNASGASSDASNETADDAVVPRSIGRVLDLFEVVLAERKCTLTTAATATDLTPTTALRYLRALETRGYVHRDDGGEFSPGPTILRIAASLRGGTVLDRLAAVAQPHLEKLATQTGESVYLAVSDGRMGTYIATAESPRSIRHVGWVGQPLRLSGSALGAALADPGVIEVRTGAVEPDITAMSLALQETGKLGVAVSIVGPEYRLGNPDAGTDRASLETALASAVAALVAELQLNGEDFTS